MMASLLRGTPAMQRGVTGYGCTVRTGIATRGRLSGEGSVVGLLVLDRRDVSQRRVEPSVVVPIDPAGGGVLDVGDGLVGAVVEDGGADALGLVEAVDGLHQGVVVGVANAADRGPNVLEREVLGEPQTGVLGEFNRSMQHRAVEASVAVPRRPRRGSSSRGSCGAGC